MNRQLLYKIAGPAKFENRLLVKNQTAADIVGAIQTAIQEAGPAAQKLALKFNTGNDQQKAEKLYYWLRQNIQYIREPSHDQTAKTIQRILADGYGDCKHFTIIAAAIMKALHLPVYIRVIDQGSRWNHIYTVLKYPGKTIIVDPVFPYFNAEADYRRKKDIKV
jgi:hypothetical protein